jgi:hypothetical protein
MKIIALLLTLALAQIAPLPKSIARTEIKWLADKNGKKISKEVEKQFNSHGDMIKHIQFLDKNILCEIFDYEYKDDHKVRLVRKSCSGKVSTITTYIYDKLGRITQEINYDVPDHKPENRYVYIYIGNTTNKASTTVYDGTDKTSFDQTSFEYYSNNGLLKREEQTANGGWFQTTTYQYDANKRLIFIGDEVDGGVGEVKTYLTYSGGILVKDMVKIPGEKTKYHIYEILK